MTEIIDGTCVFASLYHEEMCSLAGEVLGCNGQVEKCSVLKEREEALDELFAGLEGME
jgi:hypothetical protein